MSERELVVLPTLAKLAKLGKSGRAGRARALAHSAVELPAAVGVPLPAEYAEQLSGSVKQQLDNADHADEILTTGTSNGRLRVTMI